MYCDEKGPLKYTYFDSDCQKINYIVRNFEDEYCFKDPEDDPEGYGE